VIFFLVPWVGSGVLELQPDLYYLGYFTVAVAFFAMFTVRHRAELRALWGGRLTASIVIGALTGGALVAGILQQPGTGRPDGWRFAFEIGWRGLVYGSVDALTLYVLPAAVAYLLMRRNREGWRRRLGFGGLALALSLVITATYHLGYQEYRDDTMRYPLIGAVTANVPTVLTGNPVGSVVTHAAMHVTAVVHQRDGGEAHMLPPKVTSDYESRGSSDLAAALAAGWLLVAAGALVRLTRRENSTSPTEGR
jgi:MFS family permease